MGTVKTNHKRNQVVLEHKFRLNYKKHTLRPPFGISRANRNKAHKMKRLYPNRFSPTGITWKISKTWDNEEHCYYYSIDLASGKDQTGYGGRKE